MVTITLVKSADGVSGHARTSLGWNTNFTPEEYDMVDGTQVYSVVWKRGEDLE